MRRFVFVPIFGDCKDDPALIEAWVNAPHVKAWGFFEEGSFTPIHTEPECKAIELYSSNDLFDSEQAAMIDVPEGSTDLPEGVCVALAKLALLPAGCDHDWGGVPSVGAECLRCGTLCQLGGAN